MEDAKIDLIAREVLTGLKKQRAEAGSGDEARTAAVPKIATDPSAARPFHLQLLSVQGGVVGSPCIIEPDKPCVGSLKCRSLGH